MARTIPTVSLDAYRSEGVRVFSGRERGRMVGEHIAKTVPGPVFLEVPDDVFCVAPSFAYELFQANRDVILPWHLACRAFTR